MKQAIEKQLAQTVAQYPGIEVQDLLLILRQSEWGEAEDMADTAIFETKLMVELATLGLFTAKPPAPEALGGGYCRIHLSALQCGPSAKVMTKLCAQAAKEPGKLDGLTLKAKVLQNMLENGMLPYPASAADEVKEWVQAGYPRLTHSGRFRALYDPHYRVMDMASALYLPVYRAIDMALNQRAHVLVGIDGMCASGKSRLASQISQVYRCGVVLADDFFLQPSQRTPERLAEPGGNIDYERFAPVAVKAADDRAFQYQAFDCSVMQLGAMRQVPAGALTILEGAYCLHPKVAAPCDVRVFLSVDATVQLARIQKRNGEEMAARFEKEWIPMEHRYFAAFGVRESCDVIVDTTSLG